jgi:HK97 family phage portal protein
MRGLSGDGIIGYCPVDLMREALGLAKIEEEYRARFFKNDARPGAVVEYPGQLSETAYQRYKADWTEAYAGIGNKFRIAFLEQGLKWHDVGFPPETTQFIEGRKFQLEEIARILGVPLILLQSTEKATSWGTGIEQFMLAFMQFTIRPWLKRWEARINQSLFTEAERKIYFVESLIEDLLRADSLARAQMLQIWRRNGIINADDWLALENRNPLPDGKGQIYVIEGNMTRLEQVGRPIPAAAPVGKMPAEDMPNDS